MDSKEKTVITVQANIKAPVEKVWKHWSSPSDIQKWNNASNDWHTTRAENNLRIGGKFLYHMEAKDGSFGFDFSGVYTAVKTHTLIDYLMDDGRKCSVQFSTVGGNTKIVEAFEAEETNSIEMQKGGWQAILDNFKRYVESA